MEASPTVISVVLLLSIVLGVILALLQPVERIHIHKLAKHRKKQADIHNGTRTMWNSPEHIQNLMIEERNKRDQLLSNYLWTTLQFNKTGKKQTK